MKLKKMVSVTAAALAVIMAATTTASAASAAKTSQDKSQVGVQGVSQISKSPITIKIFAPKATDTPNFGELEHYKNYSKTTNVNVVWDHSATYELQAEKFNIILASGNLPDMFWNINNTAGTMNTLRSANAIIPVQKYLKDMPNFQKVVKDNPETKRAFMEPDGNVWFLPLFDGLATNDPLILRGDWLEKLNLPLPKTKDDWMKYWKGVRDTDVNGNGKADDEIPLTSRNNSDWRNWVTAFDMLDGFFVDVKDKNVVKYSAYEARYVEFLKWFNMLYNEDILDKNFASMTSTIFNTENNSNQIGSYRGKLNGNFNAYMLTMPKSIPGFKLFGTEPITTDSGEKIHAGVANFVRYDMIGGVITASSKYPAECAKFCDWFYDASDPYGGAFLNLFGLEGVTFQYNADKSKYEYTDYVLKNKDGLSSTAALQKYTTRNQQPGFNPPTSSFKMWNPLVEESFNRIEPYYTKSLAWKCENLPFTTAESKEIKGKMDDITVYVDEMVAKFVMGKEPIGNFENFRAQLKKMGIEDVLKLYNASYEKWSGPRPE